MRVNAVKKSPDMLVLITSGSSDSVLGKSAPIARPKVTIKMIVVIKRIVEDIV